MKLVVVTAESFFEGEVTAVNRLFAEGLQTLHLRKPASEADEVKSMIERINPAFHSRMVLHDHFDLANRYNLKGVHLNRRNRVAPDKVGLSISRSCHAISELTDAKVYDYAFLSPVFDSISKQGYNKAFTEKELYQARLEGLIHDKVYALGGITVKHISQVKSYGFGGVVVLGSLWGDYQETRDMKGLVDRFKALKDEC